MATQEEIVRKKLELGMEADLSPRQRRLAIELGLLPPEPTTPRPPAQPPQPLPTQQAIPPLERIQAPAPVSPEERRRALVAEELKNPPLTAPGLMSTGMEGVGIPPGDPGGKMLLGQLIGMAGPAVGTAVGALTSPVTGPVGPIAGELAGSYGARKLNVALGLEEPGMVGDVASVAIPAALRAAGPIARRLPGVSAVLHERGAQEATELAGRLRPPTPSDQLYQRIAAANPAIPTPHLQRTIERTLAQQGMKAKALQNSGVMSIAESLDQQITAHGDQLPFQNLWADLKGVGEKIGAARAQGGEGYGELRQLYRAIFEDMDEAAEASGATNAAVRMLKAANQAARKEFAAEDLAEVIAKGINVARQGDALISVNGSQMLRQFQRLLRNDELFAGSFTQAEIDSIEATFKKFARIPQLPPPSGANAGSMKSLGSGGLATAGAGLAGLGPQEVMIAAGVGAALPGLIGAALASPTGRKVVGGLLGRGELFTPTGAAVLRGALRTTLQGVGEELMP